MRQLQGSKGGDVRASGDLLRKAYEDGNAQAFIDDIIDNNTITTQNEYGLVSGE